MIGHNRASIKNGKVEHGPLTYPRTGKYSKADGYTDYRQLDIPAAAIIRTELVTAKGKTVSGILADMVKKYGGSWVCLNAAFFAPDGSLLGLTHQNGKTTYPDVKGKTEQRPHLYRKGGRFGIGRQASPAGLDWAISAVPTLVQSGSAVLTPIAAEQTPSDVTATNPRMITSIKPDGTLGIVVVDGRGTYDKGFTSREAAILAAHLGYTNAVNLDGGGSATLAANNDQLRKLLDIDKANGNKRLYHVADMGADQQERVVHHALCIQVDPAKLLPDYIVDHIPASTPKNRRSGRMLKASTLTIHNTGNPTSTAHNERAWLTNPKNDVTASYHIVIGPETTAADSRIVAIETLPLNEVGWHAGDGTLATGGNMTSIGIEICESGNYAATLEFAVQLVAEMLKERGWGVDRLRRHWDWPSSSGYRKICPRLMYNGGEWTGWKEFKGRVAAALNPVVSPPYTVSDQVNIEVNGRILEQKGTLKDGVTSVPVRVVAEALGAEVSWEETRRTVVII
ncbi:phosphodiester glycosidase family protein [Paenibacillus sp. CAU 1782]